MVSISYATLERTIPRSEGCSKLTELYNDEGSSNFTQVSTAYSMFSGCSSLTNFNLSMPKLKEAHHMFYNCSSLTSY